MSDTLWDDTNIRIMADELANASDYLRDRAKQEAAIVAMLTRLRDEKEELIAELQETLAYAAQYNGYGARGCPLCKWEDGKFIELCQMHKDLEARRLIIIGLTVERDEFGAHSAAVVLRAQQMAWEIAELRRELDSTEYEPVQNGWYDFLWQPAEEPKSLRASKWSGIHVSTNAHAQMFVIWVDGEPSRYIVLRNGEMGLMLRKRRKEQTDG